MTHTETLAIMIVTKEERVGVDMCTGVLKLHVLDCYGIVGHTKQTRAPQKSTGAPMLVVSSIHDVYLQGMLR